jgi:hypothetical protein
LSKMVSFFLSFKFWYLWKHNPAPICAFPSTVLWLFLIFLLHVFDGCHFFNQEYVSSCATCLSLDCCVRELALCTKEHNAHLITYKLSNNRDLMKKMINKYYLFVN